jgi:hypothetical protein
LSEAVKLWKRIALWKLGVAVALHSAAGVRGLKLDYTQPPPLHSRRHTRIPTTVGAVSAPAMHAGNESGKALCGIAFPSIKQHRQTCPVAEAIKEEIVELACLFPRSFESQMILSIGRG